MAGRDGNSFEKLESWVARLRTNVLESDREGLTIRLENFLHQEREADEEKTEEAHEEVITELDEGTRTPRRSSHSRGIEVLCHRCRREVAREAEPRAPTGRSDGSLVLRRDVDAWSTACAEANLWFSKMNTIKGKNPDGLHHRAQGYRRTLSNTRVQTDSIDCEDRDGHHRTRGSGWIQSSAMIQMDTIERRGRPDEHNRTRGSTWTPLNARVQTDSIEREVTSGKDTERKTSFNEYLLFLYVAFSLPSLAYLLMVSCRGLSLIPAPV